jgi:hypothetical protein
MKLGPIAYHMTHHICDSTSIHPVGTIPQMIRDTLTGNSGSCRVLSKPMPFAFHVNIQLVPEAYDLSLCHTTSFKVILRALHCIMKSFRVRE